MRQSAQVSAPPAGARGATERLMPAAWTLACSTPYSNTRPTSSNQRASVPQGKCRGGPSGLLGPSLVIRAQNSSLLPCQSLSKGLAPIESRTLRAYRSLQEPAIPGEKNADHLLETQPVWACVPGAPMTSSPDS